MLSDHNSIQQYCPVTTINLVNNKPPIILNGCGLPPKYVPLIKLRKYQFVLRRRKGFSVASGDGPRREHRPQWWLDLRWGFFLRAVKIPGPPKGPFLVLIGHFWVVNTTGIALNFTQHIDIINHTFRLSRRRSRVPRVRRSRH